MTEEYEDGPLGTAERPKQKPIAVWRGDAGFGNMPPLAESVGFLVRIIQLQSFQLFYRRFDESGLSIGALTTLGAIHANPGIRHGVLADALMIKRPNFTKVINGLELDGLIAREAPRGDKRTTALFATKKGVRKLETMRDAILAHHEEMVATLSPVERDSLLDLLQRLSRHLQSLLDQVPAEG
ncbi:MAG TPA: MarR family winged helix-turn-helix transcriptional regulator [Stellaceae bacterium]|jgi:DNA-binding MarR family transcriptional regulator|nr:MarR family winged helix-turn-helix transcriptional regulator [Stellaceae bacterium]